MACANKVVPDQTNSMYKQSSRFRRLGHLHVLLKGKIVISGPRSSCYQIRKVAFMMEMDTEHIFFYSNFIVVLFIYLLIYFFIHYFKRSAHLATLASLICGPLGISYI